MIARDSRSVCGKRSMPLWCRLRLTWSTFRFRSRDACMMKLGIMTDENTTSQQTQPTEAATEAAAETATDTDAQQQDQLRSPQPSPPLRWISNR